MNTLLAIATKPLGQRLRDRGLISEEDLKNALTLQQDRHDKLGRILVDLGYVSERDVLSVLSEQLNVDIFAGEYPAVPIEDPALPYRFLRAFHTLPVHLDDGVLSLVMADPLDLETQSAIRLRTGFALRIYLATESEILEQLERLYGGDEGASDRLIETIGDAFGGGDENTEHLRDLALEVPVIRMVNLLIARAVESQSSDIHIEPFEKDLRLRYRVDGVLHNIDPPPNQLRAAIISRIKLMAKLNIAERRLPQDGRIKLKVLGKEIDLRVSTLPTMYGESVVMRILDQSNSSLIDLRRLGFSEDLFAKVCQMTSKPHGIFLVTGPTGSGKSTTLYSALKRINIPDKKIITIEDPVEYQMDGINQIQTNPQIGLTFGSGLRHIVRQDPDVIMIGEIRDLETAEIAIRSALTGHLVFSTLHTNDAASAVTRLVDMGVEDYLLASSLIGILAQRLVRVNCPECKTSTMTPAAGLRDAGFMVDGMGDLIELQRGAGCEHCGQTGYKGRLGIFELIEINEEFRRLMVTKADATVLLSQAIRQGMRTLKQDGWLRFSMEPRRQMKFSASRKKSDGALMATFSYKAVNSSGHALDGRMDAPDVQGAAFQLQKMGLIPVSIEAAAQRSASRFRKIQFSRVSRKDILFFTEELSTLVRAGLPLDRCLSITAELAAKPALRAVILDVLKDVKGGKSLADAFAEHPRYFSRLYVNMIRAGEAGGVLEVILNRLVEFQASADELRTYLVSALIYPALLTAVGFGSIGILLYFVIPRFAAIFEDMGAAVPPSTQALLWLSDVSRNYWWVVVFGVASAAFIVRKWLRTPKGSRAWDSIQLKLPLLGPTLLKIEVGRFARTLGTLIASAVPLIVGVRIVQDIAHNQIVAEGISKIATGAKRGEGVARPMREAGVFPGLAVHLIEVGEETGRLDSMLLQIADVYEKDVRTSVKALTAVFEPAIILVMGIIVGAVVLSMLTAIFSINDVNF